MSEPIEAALLACPKGCEGEVCLLPTCARDDRPDPSVPPISWCRIFQVGPACQHLCDTCARTYRASREATR